MSTIDKQLLKNLYDSGKSMTEIANTTGYTDKQVRYWMEKHKIKRRNLSEAIYKKLNPDGDPFKIKTKFTLQEAYLFGLGVGIYMGEGNKVQNTSLRVANSDINIILLFRKFLKNICQLDSKRISYSIVCFNDSNVNTVRQYWANHLEVPPEKFGKITQIPPQGKGTYRRKSAYGVCILQASNVKLRSWMMKQIERTYQNA